MKNDVKDKSYGSYRGGFTLVELSIVLVIIGLLIGGILVGQSLIDSVKIQRQISELEQFDVMLAQFRSRYKSLPGDSKLFVDRGDGDNVWKSASRECFPASIAWDGECQNVWKHLADGVILEGTYDNDYSDLVADNMDEHAPEVTFGYLLPFSIPPTAPTTNYYFLRGNATSVALTPLEAFSIDTKIDDGIAGLADGVGGESKMYAPFGLTGCTTANGSNATYILENEGRLCNIAVEIFYSGY